MYCEPRKLPHIRQSSSARNCGAACVMMIYQHYHKKGKLSEITDRVSYSLNNGARSCSNILMLKELNSHGFISMGASVKDLKGFMIFCAKQQYEMIISYHPIKDDPASHFSLVSYLDEDAVYINDPNKDNKEGVSRPISFAELEEMMKRHPNSSELLRDNVIIVAVSKDKIHEVAEINIHDSSQPLIAPVPIFVNLLDKIESFIIPCNPFFISPEQIAMSPVDGNCSAENRM